LVANNFTDSSLTSGRVTYAGAAGNLVDSANLTFDGTTLTATGNAIVSDNSANAALRITQTGAGNALLVEDSTSPDSTPLVITSTGNFINGYTSSLSTRSSTSSVTPKTQFSGDGANTASVAIFSGTANPTFYFAKSNDTLAAPTAVSDNSIIGRISAAGYDGTLFTEAGSVRFEVDGTPGTNDMPGRLVFSTTADGAATPTERLRIASTGAFGLSGANYGDAGQVLTSAGSGAAPTWSTASGGGGGVGSNLYLAVNFGGF
jgi:hypothetical protein